MVVLYFNEFHVVNSDSVNWEVVHFIQISPLVHHVVLACFSQLLFWLQLRRVDSAFVPFLLTFILILISICYQASRHIIRLLFSIIHIFSRYYFFHI